MSESARRDTPQGTTTCPKCKQPVNGPQIHGHVERCDGDGECRYGVYGEKKRRLRRWSKDGEPDE